MMGMSLKLIHHGHRPLSGDHAMHVVFGSYDLEVDKRELRHAGEVVPLEPKAFKVLVYLLTHRHRAVSKSELLETLWPEEYVTESALSRSVRLIRQAVGDAGHQQHIIKTLRGYGYRFVADVTLPRISRLCGRDQYLWVEGPWRCENGFRSGCVGDTRRGLAFQRGPDSTGV
jgi:DNA-binding winged helix-turn-helix (wHTH) protein